MTLKEAIGYAGKDKRWKNDPNERQPCGFLGDKLLANISQGSINTLRCGLENFMRFAGPDLQCRAVSPELIKSWLISGGDKESHWESNTQKHYGGHVRNLFNWCIRQDVVTENPVLKLEKINLDPFDPYVLTVDECRKVLNLCWEKHREILPLLALNLFCGIRPSETRRLNSGKGRDCNFDWEDNEVVFQAKKTKTKMRRFVEMSDNCLAWLNLQELNLPIVNANHKWDRFLQDAKKELEYKAWPHDCIRHSFCSYGLRHSENAAKVALQAGNTERVLFRHYLKLVKKPEAEKFWNIFPEKLAA
jgi:integrase